MSGQYDDLPPSIETEDNALADDRGLDRDFQKKGRTISELHAKTVQILRMLENIEIIDGLYPGEHLTA